MARGMSRRSFVTAAGAMAGAAALAGAGASAATASETEASGDAPAAGDQVCAGNWSWSFKPAAIPDDQIAETVDCDICVVGLGMAGAPAALYAAMSGAKTVVLQKESAIAFNGQNVGAWGGKRDAELGIVSDFTADTERFAKVSDGFSNIKLVSNIIRRSGEVLDWYTEAVPSPAAYCTVSGNHIRFQWYLDGESPAEVDYPSIVGNTGAFPGIAKFMSNVAEKVAEAGADIRYSTPAVQLLTDEGGAVTGAVAQAEDGSYIKVNASKGVILCTGDIVKDEEMLEAYAPFALGIPTGTPYQGNTGDGFKMGLWAGAAADPTVTNVQIHPTNPDKYVNGMRPFNMTPVLHVNVEGRRFMNEEVGTAQYGGSIGIQTGGYAYQIVDSHFPESYSGASEAATAHTTSGTAADIDKLVEIGTAFRADTLEGLAEAAGIDYEALQETVDRYNELVAGGIDYDYAVSSETLAKNAIVDPPFVAIRRDANNLGVSMGLRCNEYCQVLNKEEEPIAGLYAAGGPQGSFFPFIYPVDGFGGLSCGRAAVGGVLAVKHALGTWDQPC